MELVLNNERRSRSIHAEIQENLTDHWRTEDTLYEGHQAIEVFHGRRDVKPLIEKSPILEELYMRGIIIPIGVNYCLTRLQNVSDIRDNIIFSL